MIPIEAAPPKEDRMPSAALVNILEKVCKRFFRYLLDHRGGPYASGEIDHAKIREVLKLRFDNQTGNRTLDRLVHKA